MKKMKFLSGLAILAMVGMFTSCEESTDAVGPDIGLTGSGGFISENETVETSAELPFKWTANAGDAKLATFTIFRDGTIEPTWNNVEIPNAQSDSYTAADTLTAPATVGTFTYSFVIVDKDGLADTVSVDITTEEPEPVGTLATYSIQLGGQSNTTVGSFFASLSGDVYTITELKAGSHFNSIDIIYYVGATNKEALFSPKEIVNSDITWSSNVATDLWGTSPNDTKFKKGVAADYDDATFASVQTLGADASLNIANGGASPIAGLKVGDVYAFKTAGGKYGVLKVSAVVAGATETINIDIKVQE